MGPIKINLQKQGSACYQKIDYEKLEQCYIDGRLKSETEIENRKKKEKERERDDWRKRVGYNNYDNEPDGWLKTIKIYINALKCACRSLSGKKEYRRKGLWSEFMILLLKLSVFGLIYTTLFALSIILFMCTFPCLFLPILECVNTNTVEIQALTLFLKELPADNNIATAPLWLFALFLGFVFREIKSDVEDVEYGVTDNSDRLFGFLLGC